MTKTNHSVVRVRVKLEGKMSKVREVDFDVLDGAMTQWRKERGEEVTGRRARNSNT